MKCEDDILWEEYFSLFKAYLNSNGEYPKKGHSLYNWMRTQRSIYKTVEEEKEEGKIIPDYILTRIAKLKENDFIFEPRVIRPKWQKNFKLLKQYLADNDGNYPVDGDLYKWIDNQRMIHEKGKRKNGIIIHRNLILTEEEEKKLDEIKFDWERATIWKRNLTLLKQYLEEHDGKYPRRNERYRGVHLYKWVNTQRTIYNNGKKKKDGTIVYENGKLTRKQINLLNDMDFLWIAKKEEKEINSESFDKNFNLLKSYLEDYNGHYPKKGELYNGFNLYNWIGHIRSIFNNGEVLNDGTIIYNKYRLTIDQIKKLDSINFIWVVNKNVYFKKTIENRNDMRRREIFLYCELEKLLLKKKLKEANKVKNIFIKTLE